SGLNNVTCRARISFVNIHSPRNVSAIASRPRSVHGSVRACYCRCQGGIRRRRAWVELAGGRAVEGEELQIGGTAKIRRQEKFLRLIERQRKWLRAHRGKG